MRYVWESEWKKQLKHPEEKKLELALKLENVMVRRKRGAFMSWKSTVNNFQLLVGLTLFFARFSIYSLARVMKKNWQKR